MTTVAFIGIGRMGLPMAANLLRKGFSVVGVDRDPERLDLLLAQGATTAQTAAEAASRADVTISMIMNDAILRQVAMGTDGVFAGARLGHVYADLSTVTPAASADVRAAAETAGVGYVCGKVAGSIGLAEAGTLSLFASGPAADFARCEPVFAAMAAQVRHVGEGEAAAYLKLVHSIIIGAYSSVIGEALAFGERGGLALDTIVDILESGPLGSRQLTLKAPILKERRFSSPPSDIDTAAKDMDLILDTARRDAMPLPVSAAVRQVMATAQAAGQGKRDIYAILETFEALGGLRPAGATSEVTPAKDPA